MVLLLFFGSEVMTLPQGPQAKDVRAAASLNLPFSLHHKEIIQELSYLEGPGDRYNYMIYEVAKQQGMDPALIKAIIEVESDFDPRSVSPVGAVGLMQLMPETAYLLKVQNVFDPKENIRGGVVFVRYLLRSFRGDLRLSLAAYNAGPKVVRQYRGIPPYEETQTFVKRVLSRYEHYRRQGAGVAA